YVTHDQINSVLSSEEVNSEQIEDVLAMFSEMGDADAENRVNKKKHARCAPAPACRPTRPPPKNARLSRRRLASAYRTTKSASSLCRSARILSSARIPRCYWEYSGVRWPLACSGRWPTTFASLEIICPALTRRRSRCSLARQAVAPVPAERGRLCRFSKPECRRGWSCPTAKASPAVWHALRGARNHPRFEASSAWIFRPSYHRQDCALRRRVCASAEGR